MFTLPSDYQTYIHQSRYSRHLWEEGRRETWEETVDRYFNFFKEHLKENNQFDVPNHTIETLKDAVLNLKVMPSMRCLMTAGEALKKENIAGYNCAYIAVDRVNAFDEILYILMNGTGVGFSVEQKDVAKLPFVAEEFYKSDVVIPVADSKVGWAKSLKQLIALLYQGMIPSWDTSKVRPAGSPLKTFGGRASGPEPLEDLFRFIVGVFHKAAGRKLTSLECHDIICKIAEIVVVGGVRRSALISLSDLNDEKMRVAKSGQWWEMNSQRRLANNSACYSEKPDVETYVQEFLSLIQSKSGERGLFNREASVKQAERNGRRKVTLDGLTKFDGPYDSDRWIPFGTNPCSEIILRSKQFCNLSEVVIRADDTIETLKEKIYLAAILGTFQSTLTNFKYISKKWKENCDEERLLGVSLTGIMDNDLTNGRAWKSTEDFEAFLTDLKNVAIEANKDWAEEIGIPQSAAISCVKPSGCFDPDQKVRTTEGVKSFREIFAEQGINLDEKQDDYREWYGLKTPVFVYDENNDIRPVTKLFINGVEETYEIEMEDGSIFKCTPNHKFKLMTGEWKKAKDLKEDDDIMCF